jgi:cytochrome c nitrite reductase small subunit
MNLPAMKSARLGLAAVVAAVLLGALGGSGAYTFSYAEGLSYLSDDPKACVNCHVMREQYDGWQKAGHHAHATCNDCHVPQDTFGRYTTKALHGWRHSKAFTLDDFAEPIRILPEDLDIVHDNCVRCHNEIVSELAPSPHAAVESERYDCTRCHASVAHGPRR